MDGSHLHRSRQILTYLIPCHLLTTRTLPGPALLQPYPTLSNLLTPLCKAICLGSLSHFDAALSAGEVEFVRRRIYLTLERGRDICLRNLFRKVFKAGGFEEGKNEKSGEVVRIRRTRVSIAEFEAGMRISLRNEKGEVVGELVDRDEVECFLANMIYKVSLLDNVRADDTALIKLEFDERLHCTRARCRGVEQDWCISRNGRLM